MDDSRSINPEDIDENNSMTNHADDQAAPVEKSTAHGEEQKTLPETEQPENLPFDDRGEQQISDKFKLDSPQDNGDVQIESSHGLDDQSLDNPFNPDFQNQPRNDTTQRDSNDSQQWDDSPIFYGDNQWISPASQTPSFFNQPEFNAPIGDTGMDEQLNELNQSAWFSETNDNAFLGHDTAIAQDWNEGMDNYQFSDELNQMIGEDPSLFNYDVSSPEYYENEGWLSPADTPAAMANNNELLPENNPYYDPYYNEFIDPNNYSAPAVDPYLNYLNPDIGNNIDPYAVYYTASGQYIDPYNIIYDPAAYYNASGEYIDPYTNAVIGDDLYYDYNDYNAVNNENDPSYIEDNPALEDVNNVAEDDSNVSDVASETVTAFLGSTGNDYFYVPGGGLDDYGAYVSAGDGEDLISTVGMDGTQSFVYIDPGEDADTIKLSSVVSKTDYIYIDNGDLYNSTTEEYNHDTISYFQGYGSGVPVDVLLLDKDMNLYENYNAQGQVAGIDYDITADNAPNGVDPLPTWADLLTYSNSQDTAADSGITVNGVNISSSNLMTIDSSTDSDTLINLGQTTAQYFVYDTYSKILYADIDASSNTYGIGDTGSDLSSDLTELAPLATINLLSGSLTADNIAITDFGSNTISDPTTTILLKGTTAADSETLTSTQYYSASAGDDTIDASGLSGASFAMILGGDGEDTITLSNTNTATDYILFNNSSEVYNTDNGFTKTPDLVSGFSTGDDMILFDEDMTFDTYFLNQETFGGVSITGDITTSTLGDLLSLGTVGDMDVSSTNPALGATPTALSSDYFKTIDSSSGSTDLDALQDTNDYFIYDTNTDTLYFDPDASNETYGMDNLSELAQLVVISDGTDINASDIGFIDIQSLNS